MHDYSLENIRSQIIGGNILFDTPFGKRHLLYADYTASGRGLALIESKLINILKSYANTHTEDDYSGKITTGLMHDAENTIKSLVNAGPKGKIIPIGSGTTGALKKLQEILGVTIPPATRDRMKMEYGTECFDPRFRPLVFIGPYEHHTNELMWRESIAEVRKIPFGHKGVLDLSALEAELSREEYHGRLKIGSFSAGSNITGIRTPTEEVARICHRRDALAFFDFAAVAPYIPIDMNIDHEAYYDAIFFSPHKFLGGPGACGLLIFREDIYRTDLPPTTAGGGTVDFVGFSKHDFSSDIETREKAGTPPILQVMKAALVLELKDKIGTGRIEETEEEHKDIFLNRLNAIPNIEMVGEIPRGKRVPIVSFNIRHQDRILHPKFVTMLLNDLFGIQSRAGCSCAGPYGHILMHIEEEKSRRIRSLVKKGYQGLKPGWVRINLHYSLSREDVAYMLKAIDFVAAEGEHFIKEYAFNMKTGGWSYLSYMDHSPVFGLDNHFNLETIRRDQIPELRNRYLKEARRLAVKLKSEPGLPFFRDSEDVEAVKDFYYINKKR
jgi:selenocysteine lyase/cysteine desulfurase